MGYSSEIRKYVFKTLGGYGLELWFYEGNGLGYPCKNETQCKYDTYSYWRVRKMRIWNAKVRSETCKLDEF